MKLTSSQEEYLKTIYLLEMNSTKVRVTDIANKLKITKPSVNKGIKCLREIGLVNYETYGNISLTDEGERMAVGIIKRQDILEMFLEEVLEIDRKQAIEEAKAMKHVVSENTAIKLDKYITEVLNLGDLDCRLVLQAVKKTIIESPYPPTIHDIRKNAIEMVSPNTMRTPIEAWNEAYGMICNGLYMTEEEFNEHSPEVKKFFGNVAQVRELAMTDTKTVNTVTKGQFLKQYEILVEREKQQKLLPKQMQDMIGKLANKMDINRLQEKNRDN